MTETQEQAQERTVGVVLAGGRSQRMGTDKASLRFDGVPLLRRVVEQVAAALPDVIVVGSQTLQPLVPGLRVVPDKTPGRGPLGGILTAFEALPSLSLFVVACDMPFVEPALVGYMAHLAEATPDVDVLALRTARGLEPLHALYRSSSVPAMRTQFEAGEGAMHHLLACLRVREVSLEEASRYDPTGLSTFNANTPEEWEKALARLSDGAK